ncbi:hypothetical protein ACHQM5_022451 [Ranunculus cassubicifolius]
MSRWIFETEMEDSTFFDQYQMDYSDDLTPEQLAAAYGQDNQPVTKPTRGVEDDSPSPFKLEETCLESATKKLKTTTDSWKSSTMQPAVTPKGSSFPTMFSFGISNSPTSKQQFYEVSSDCVKPKEKVKSSTKKRASIPSIPSATAQDHHIIAERKRREKLSQRFIALSALVPDLKKMDKTSVLEDCIKYIKKLQERVKALEEQTAKTTMESVVYIKKIYILSDNDSSSTEEIISHEPLPEIHARASAKNVMIRIHCENQKGVLGNALAEIEKLNLSVENSSILSFGTSTLDITVMAQMDEGYKLKVVDLVKKLRLAFQKFM